MENPRNTPRLETPRLILRRFVPEDAPALWELLRDRDVNRFLPWFPVETLAEAEKFLRERFLDTYRTETGWRYAVCLREEPERPLGYVNIAPGEAHDLGYGLEKACWHRGLMTEAARAVVEGSPHPLDLGAHNDRYFSYVASFGAFTKASYSASQETKNALGHFAYILEGIKNLDSLRPYRCGVEADGESFDGDFIFGAVCNSTSLGGLVKLDPKRVHMDDGMFELILLRMPKTALDLQNLITALNRMDYDYPGVIFRHVRSVTVTTREDIPWSLDGEYAPSAPRVEIRNLHSAVHLMIQDDE